jgi:CubicO group peptidase (beta-lactamase class C family)
LGLAYASSRRCDATYWNVLAEYRNQFAYKSAVTEDFRDVAESVSGKDLDAFFQQWIYEPGAPAYTWGWQTTAVNGKNYLMTSINQTSAATYGLFTLPIDIRPTVGGVKQFLKVQNDATTEWFVLPLTGPATACTFDEDVWILNTGVTSAGYTPGPPKIVEISPSPGSTVLRPTNQIKV